jgi:hypothetical protein
MDGNVIVAARDIEKTGVLLCCTPQSEHFRWGRPFVADRIEDQFQDL